MQQRTTCCCWAAQNKINKALNSTINSRYINFLGTLPAIRSNLFCRTSAQKNFTAIGA
jgi:hypothetical protein